MQMERHVKKKEELALSSKRPEMMKNKALALKKLDPINKILSLPKNVLRTFVVVGGVDFGALVLKIFPKSTKQNVSSRSFIVIVGSLQGVNLPPEQIKGNTIELVIEKNKKAPSKTQSVQNSQGTAASRGFSNIPQKNTQQIVVSKAPQLDIQPYEESSEDYSHPRDMFTITAFKGYTLSAPDNEVAPLSFGNVIKLRGVRVKEHIDPNTKRVANFINASNIERYESTLADTYKSLVDSLYHVKISADLNKQPIREDTATHYSENYQIFRVEPIQTLENSLVVHNSCVGTFRPTQQEQDWVTQGRPDKPSSPCLRGIFSVLQWTGDCYNGEIPIVVSFEAYKESIRCFYISNFVAWRRIGPCILPMIPFVVVGQENVYKTNCMSFNATRDSSLQNGNQKDNDPFQFAICLSVVGILADAPTYYAKIGIPVTLECAKVIYEEEMSGIPLEVIKTFHNENAHSQGVTNMYCMNEYNGDPNVIWNAQGVQFRVITNTDLKPELMKACETLTPKQGSDLINTFTGGMKLANSDYPSDHPVNKIELGTGGELVRYLFAILPEKGPGRENAAGKMFIDGVKVVDEEHRDEHLDQTQQPQQLPQIKAAPPRDDESTQVISESQLDAEINMLRKEDEEEEEELRKMDEFNRTNEEEAKVTKATSDRTDEHRREKESKKRSIKEEDKKSSKKHKTHS